MSADFSLDCVFEESMNNSMPIPSDVIDRILSEHRAMAQRIEHIASAVSDSEAVDYFFQAAHTQSRGHMPSPTEVFQLINAKAALDASYWSKTLQLTDVIDCMPAQRREAWFEQIRTPIDRHPVTRQWVQTIAPFEEQTVRSTIQDLLNMRPLYMAERVDGIFRSLSGTHITNQPEGFSKRMIFAGLLDKYGFSNSSKTGVINDLRNVIAKFHGRGELSYQITEKLMPTLQANIGQWVSVDGGALRIKLYQKGTAHIEVHPDVAYKINMVLANLHPHAIPSSFRKKQTTKAKEFTLVQQAVPNQVLCALSGLAKNNGKTLYIHSTDKSLQSALVELLESIGGTFDKNTSSITFDYFPQSILNEICTFGSVPDRLSHQFYSTTEDLALQAVAQADIERGHSVLEPSAGIGGIAKHLPKDQTTCIEVDALRCNVLAEQGLSVRCQDFMSYSESTFDRIVMNPPFSEGRWQAHTKHAAGLLNSKGVLVAILPSNAPHRLQLDGFDLEWSEPIHDAFMHTSISVVILTATKTQ